MKGKAVGHNQRVSQRGKVFGSHPLITEGRKKLNQDQPMQQLQSQVPPLPLSASISPILSNLLLPRYNSF